MSAGPGVSLETAIEHHRAGRLGQAEALYRSILGIAPQQPDALHLLGLIAHQAGRHAAALELMDRAIALYPGNGVVYSNRGNTLRALGRHEAAMESFDLAIAHAPSYAEAHFNRGILLHDLKRYEEALASYGKAIELGLPTIEVYNNRGNTLIKVKRFDQALESFDRCLEIMPDDAEAHSNRGNALLELKRYAKALESYDRAIELQPGMAKAHSNRGYALFQLRQHEAAMASCDQAIRLDARDAEAWSNRAMALNKLRQFEEGMKSSARAIELNPELAEAYYNLGDALQEGKRYDLALKSFDRALALQPDYEYLAGMRLFLRLLCCDWEGIETECARLEDRVGRGEKATPPFNLLAVNGSAALQRKAAETYARDQYARPAPAMARKRRGDGERIRIGYFSGDFREHPVSYLMAEVFERHDRERFEIFGFSFGGEDKAKVHGMRSRVSQAMDKFVDVSAMPDEDVARLSRELGVDIAVDLTGHTQGSRPGIFAARAAPVQVNFLGYPGTIGAGHIDYLIADETLIPEASRIHYTEKIAYLPDCFQANGRTTVNRDEAASRRGEGLPERGFVYCCFNNNFKISPDVFDVWMRVLRRVEGSVLWLLADNPFARDNLRREAARRGIDVGRLIFAERVSLDKHLVRQGLADLFLDTTPFNAGATATPALWAGLPVLTCMSEAFAGRMAASLLSAIGLPELIAATMAEYEELAVQLALAPRRLEAIKTRLRRNRETMPLFDTARFTRALESAYCAMEERQRARLPPEHLWVGAEESLAASVWRSA